MSDRASELGLKNSLEVLINPATEEKQDDIITELQSLLTNISGSDPFPQYFLLAGRSGGQIAYGGVDANDDLTLGSTSHATKGAIICADILRPDIDNTYDLGSSSVGWKDLYLADNARVANNMSVGLDDVGDYWTPTTVFEVMNGDMRVLNGSAGASYAFTLQVTGGGPRLLLGKRTDADAYFSLGAYSSVINFDCYTDTLFKIAGSERFRMNADGVIINEQGLDLDTRIEGNTDVNLTFWDAGNDMVGIGTNNPGYKLDVNGAVNVTDNEIYFNTDLFIHTLGTNNLFMGVGSGASVSDGQRLVGIGNNALASNVSGDDSVAIGNNALTLSTAGDNVAIGSEAGAKITTAIQCVAIGMNALATNETTHTVMAIGANAFRYATLAAGVAVGTQAGQEVRTGTGLIIIGPKAFKLSTTASNVVAIGKDSGNNYTGSYGTGNTMIGGSTFDINTEGTYCTGIGAFSGYNSNNCSNVTYIGADSGRTANGDNTVAIGRSAGRDSVGVGCVYIGYQCAYGINTGNNKLYIENSNSATPLIYGEFDNDLVIINGNLIVNEQGADLDTRIEGSTDVNLLYIDAGNDRVGIGTDSPLGSLHVKKEGTVIFDRILTGGGGQQASMSIGLSGNASTVGTGPSMLFFADDNGGNKEYLGRVSGVWENPASGNEEGAIIISVRADSADRNATTERVRVTANGDVLLGGTTSAGADIILSQDGTAVFNEQGNDVDLRVEGVGQSNAYFLQGSDGYSGFNNGAPLAQVDIIGDLRCGDSTTNYAEFKSDGELNLYGDARVYKNEWITVGSFRVPGTKPATQVDHGISAAWEFSDATDDTIYATIRLPQDMDRTVAPEFRLGWDSDTADPGDDSKQAVWQVEYLWRTANEDMTAAAQETLTCTASASTTTNGLVICTFTGVDLPSASDQILQLRIKRLGADGSDTLGDVAYLNGFGMKYTMDKLGVAL